MTLAPESVSAPWTIGRLLAWTSDYLRRHEIDEPRLAAEVLLAHAAGWRRIDLYARFDGSLEEAPTARFREWVRRAATHEPVAYLIGEREFFSLPFQVTRDVLIPRPETEGLVEFVVDHCKRIGAQQPNILDVGTGSGCIAVSILVQLGEARCVATDLSKAALAVAEANAQRHRVADRMHFLPIDRLAIPSEMIPEGGFQVMVCNPPYIAASGVAELAACIRDFEPHEALTDGGDGLSFYRTIAVDGPRVLAADGFVVLEVGDGQAAEVISTMVCSGAFVHHATQKDRVVGKERVVVFSRT